ncbi:barstar family protein [Streptomyces sp. NPDC060085]|uniref:barstar family protein n=1 Tax=Streptomyces sp. NPDC060085 TaxID=3347054 RepID=UPI003665A2A0
MRDDQGIALTEQRLRTEVRAWRPSSLGSHLIDLELDGELEPVPEHAQAIWNLWLTGPPDPEGSWASLDTRQREAWLDLVRERGCRLKDQERPLGHTYVLDGRHITEIPGLYLALGEAVQGPGGYFGGNLDALVDCLRGDFGYNAPATLLWRQAAVAREHLAHLLGSDGGLYDLFDLGRVRWVV